MRPSQYHYIKRMLSRELYRKQLQKKNKKLRKKKLRKKKRQLRKQKRQIRRQEKLLQKQMHPEIYKNAYLRKPYSLKAGDKNLLLLFGTISLGLITILLVIQWLLDVENVFKQIGVLRGMALLAVETFTFGGPTYLCYHFYKKNKNSDYNQSGSTQNQYREPPKSYNLVDANSNTYKCPSCGNIANPNYHYCIVCGHSLQSIQSSASTSEKEKVKCPHCNKMIDFDCRFCTECGYPLSITTVEPKNEKIESINEPDSIITHADVAEISEPKTEHSVNNISLNTNFYKMEYAKEIDAKTLYFKSGQLCEVSPPGSIYSYGVRYINSDGVLYDLNNLNDLDRLPVPNFEPCDSFNGYGITGSLDYFLKMKAANLRDNGLIEQSDFLYRRLYLFMSASGNWLREKDYLGYSKILLRELRFEESECEERKIRMYLEDQPIIKNDDDEQLKDRDRNEYYHIVYTLPYDAPKSFSAYRRMKNAKTENFLELAKKAEQRGIYIKYGA